MPIDILKALEAKGISIETIAQAALALYVPYEKVDAEKDMDKIKHKLKDLIVKQCKDINVQLLVEAAIHLEDEFEAGELEIDGDPANVLSDELIGMAIAEYIGGKKALFNFVRYDTKKPGILSSLGIFLDDAVAGLIAGCMTKLFEDLK